MGSEMCIRDRFGLVEVVRFFCSEVDACILVLNSDAAARLAPDNKNSLLFCIKLFRPNQVKIINGTVPARPTPSKLRYRHCLALKSRCVTWMNLAQHHANAGYWVG